MNISREAYERLKLVYKDKESFTQALEWAEGVANRIRMAKSKLNRESKEWATRRELLKQAVTTAARDCLHDACKHYPDPSGNNDSHWECLICEQTFHTHPRQQTK